MHIPFCYEDVQDKGLFKMFNLIGLGEHAGSWVPDIYHAWMEAGLDEPVVEEKFGGNEPDRTILTLPLMNSYNQDLFKKGPKKDQKKDQRVQGVELRNRKK